MFSEKQLVWDSGDEEYRDLINVQFYRGKLRMWPAMIMMISNSGIY